jgi:hypothetical protein
MHRGIRQRALYLLWTTAFSGSTAWSDAALAESGTGDPSATAAMQQVAAPEVRIRSVSTSGSGCQAGTVDTFVNETGVHMFFNNFTLYADARTRATEANCTAVLTVPGVRGISYAVSAVQTLASLALPAESVLRTTISHGVAASVASPASREVKGPQSGSSLHSLLYSTPQWSPCGRDVELIINISALLSAGRPAESLADLTSLLVNLETRTCS